MEEYRIEQFPASKNKEKRTELLRFVRQFFENAFNVKQNLNINHTIEYARNIYSSETGKAYYGTAEDDFDYDDSGKVRGTKRFTSKIVTRKIDEAASIITDSRPKTYIEIAAVLPKIDPDKPQEAMQAEFDQNLQMFGGVIGLRDTIQACVDEWWDKRCMDKECRDMVVAALRDRNTILNVYQDNEIDDGDGDAILTTLDPLNFVPEPGVQKLDDMRYYFYVRRLDKARAEDEYGDIVIDIQGGDSLFEKRDDKEDDRGDLGYDDLIMVVSLWRDNTTVKTENEEGEEEEVPLYPNGRIITWCGDTIIDDKANDQPFRPWEIMNLMSNPGSFWGRSMAVELAAPQEHFDKYFQMASENLQLCGNMTTFLKEGVVPEGKLTDLPGAVVEIDANRDMREIMHSMNPQIVARDCYELLNICSKIADDISGVHPTAEGNRPKSVQSGRAIISLQEATNRFMRHRARTFEIVLQKCMQKVVYLIYKNYKKGRFYTKSLEGQKTFAQLPLDFDSFNIIFNVTVAPGSSLPKDKESLANLAMSLYQMNPQVWDAEFVNEKLELGPEMRQRGIVAQFETLKQKTAQMLQQSGGSPEGITQLVQSGQVPPLLLQAVMQDVQNQRAQAQQRVGPGQGQPQPGVQSPVGSFIG